MVKSWNKHDAFVCTGYNMKKHRAYRMHSKLPRVTNNFSNQCQTRVLCRGLEGAISLYKQMHPDSQLS
jgi:hypothetical protein